MSLDTASPDTAAKPFPQKVIPPYSAAIPLSEMQKRSLFVSVPMYGGMCVGTFSRAIADLTSLCLQNGIELKIHYLFNESLIPRARNYCSDEFLRAMTNPKAAQPPTPTTPYIPAQAPRPFSHFMFIDADISFNPGDILGMMAMMGDDDPYDILCGPYPKKCISWEKVKMAVDKRFADKDPNVLENFVGDYVFNPKGTVAGGQIRIDQPVEVLEGGTGFMMIKRKTFERFAEHFPQYMYRPDHIRTKAFDGSREIMQFFQAEIDQLDFGVEYKAILGKVYEALTEETSDRSLLDVAKIIDVGMQDVSDRASKKSKRYLSEDYWFCQKAQEAGLKVFLCPWVRLQHAGTYVYSGSLFDLAQLGASPTADPTQIKAVGEDIPGQPQQNKALSWENKPKQKVVVPTPKKRK